MVRKEKLTVGLFGIGLDTYWPQFAGLKERLEGYQSRIGDQIKSAGNISLVDAGLVDNPARSDEAAALFRQEQVDIIFLYISTYALSSTVMPVVQNANEIWNSCGSSNLRYHKKSRLLSPCLYGSTAC